MKLKKIIATALVSVFILILSGCGAYSKVENKSEGEETTSMFVMVEQAFDWNVVYHKDTKVMYVVSSGSYTHGIFTLLVNPDGTPMIYEGSE